MTRQPQMPNAKPAEIVRDPTTAEAARPLRLLIVAGNLALLRGHYEGVIARLVRDGGDGQRPLSEGQRPRGAGVPRDFAQGGRRGRGRAVPRRRRGPAELFALRLREVGNILRYSHPDYTGRTVLGERAFEKTGKSAQRWGRRIRRLGPTRATFVARMLSRLESTLPASATAAALVAEERPDAIAVAPVIRVPALVDYLKAGASSGLGTAIWVQSWDNLTNKGLLHFVPDRVFVWNESQLAELSRYHGVEADHVCVTGAQTFDHWFGGDPPVERREFCASLGIDPERPIILYLASSRGIAPDEPAFFARWLAAIRGSDDPVVNTASVLLRPHPTLGSVWHARRFDREPGVAVSPATLRDRLNSDPFREQYRAELHHATLAFGINTSGQIDAAIFGKPVCTVELPELFHGQQGTVHFEHLARGERSLLRTASSLDQHLVDLGELVRRDPYAQDPRSVDFIRRSSDRTGWTRSQRRCSWTRWSGSAGAGLGWLPLGREERVVGRFAMALAAIRRPDPEPPARLVRQAPLEAAAQAYTEHRWPHSSRGRSGGRSAERWGRRRIYVRARSARSARSVRRSPPPSRERVTRLRRGASHFRNRFSSLRRRFRVSLRPRWSSLLHHFPR